MEGEETKDDRHPYPFGKRAQNAYNAASVAFFAIGHDGVSVYDVPGECESSLS
jgi:hypothetical protein